LKTEKNISLKPYNTFGIDVKSDHFTEVGDVQAIRNFIQVNKDLYILGGGSNILLTRDLKKPVLKISTKGISVLGEHSDEHFVFVQVQAGENWHDFVCWCLKNNFGGLENLSLIPGNVGTSPMQNIGAYGVELKDVFHSLNAVEIATGIIRTFDKEACAFGYRDSFFKQEGKNRFIILDVTFRLTRKDHIIKMNYGAIKEELDKKRISHPGIQDISEAVIAIRKSKLPDPKEIGNSGSFFKNPVVSIAHFESLKAVYPHIPNFSVSEDLTKVPAGWLIEQCGFKGKRVGDAGVHKNQALVLVNYGNASGKEIYDLAVTIQNTVQEKFGIALEMEVNILE
jgi:UDP-N-acetylmuramate dehydrogenase